METLQFIKRPDLLPAGQITGVEGYVESTAIGLLAGLNAARLANAEPPVVPPPVTAMGALIAHLTNRDVKHFQPSNINFGLFKRLGKKIPKRFRGEHYAERALEALEKWLDTENVRRKE
jgi:methylenetetrahydrofolate--tRNA-(uracil-5-)-methyltransferase